MKQEDLKILIDKFMSGTTTLDEEKALGDFFRMCLPNWTPIGRCSHISTTG